MNRFRPCLIALALYALLATAMTWPLAAHLSTHVPGTGSWAFDESTFIWNMWWFKFSLLDLGQSPLHTDFIFYPLGIDLVTYTFNFFNAALGLPLQLGGLELALSSNLVILFAFISSAFGGYLLMLDLLAGRRQSHSANRIAAFVAGSVYAFAASRMIYAALGHYNLLTVQAFPFYALFLHRTLRRSGLLNPILAGLFAAFGLLADMQLGVLLAFYTVLAVVFTVPDFRRHRARKSHPASLPRTVARLAVVSLTAAIVSAPVLVPNLLAFRTGGFELQGWGEGLKLSADLVGWFTPTALHPLLGPGNWPAHLRAVVEGKGPFGDVNTVFLGFGILALSVLGAVVAWRRARSWAWGAIVFAVLTLGPVLQIKGKYLFPLNNLFREQGIPQDVAIPLPFALLHYIPFVKANRVPNRFSVVLTLALAVLIGFGAAWLIARVRRGEWQGVLGAALLVVVLFDQASMPLPLTDARVPSPYEVVAHEPGDFAVLHIPLGWRNSFGTRGAERTQLQYYQSYHRKRMLAGNTSRNADFKFDYFTRIPLIRALIEKELYREPDEDTLARAREQASELVALYDIRFLIVHDPLPYRYPELDTTGPTRDLALSLLPVEAEPVAEGEGAAVYRMRVPALPDPLHVDLGEWRAWPYRGEGWEEDEEVFGVTANWVLGTRAELLFPVRDPAEGRTIQVAIAPFAYPAARPQTVRPALNGREIGPPVTLKDGWQTVELALPAEGLRAGVNTLTLIFDHATAPAEVAPGDGADTRPLAAAVDWFEVE